MYGMNPYIVKQVRNDYAEHLSEAPCVVDCSLGTNPYGGFPDLADCRLSLAEITQYPHSEQPLKEAILAHYAEAGLTSTEQILPTCGSMGALLTLNRAFLREGRVVVGVAPQFTAMIDDFYAYGVDYRGVRLRRENNYAFSAADFLAEMTRHPGAMIYIDNPNNPTGQIIPLEDLRGIVMTARCQNSFVIIDEAYGEYLPAGATAASLVAEFDNLAVVRTFSKGYGAAGVRLGYLLSNAEVVRCLQKVNVPFAMNAFADRIARALLESGWDRQSMARVVDDKARFIAGLQRIRMAETAPTVSIGAYYVDDEGIDLEAVFADAGMRVVSCRGYTGLGANVVRINLNKDVDSMLACLAKAEAALAARM